MENQSSEKPTGRKILDMAGRLGVSGFGYMVVNAIQSAGNRMLGNVSFRFKSTVLASVLFIGSIIGYFKLGNEYMKMGMMGMGIGAGHGIIKGLNSDLGEKSPGALQKVVDTTLGTPSSSAFTELADMYYDYSAQPDRNNAGQSNPLADFGQGG